MSDKKRDGADPYAHLSARTSSGSGRTGLIIGAVVAVVVLVALIVALVIGSGEGTADDVVQEAAAVIVSGEQLPGFPENQQTYVADPATDPAVGRVAPTLRGQNFQGEDVEVDPTDGTAKVVIFAAHWCPHCQQEIPLIADWVADGNLPDDVELVVVSTAVRDGASQYPPSKWLASTGWEGPVMLDNSDNLALIAYGGGGFPYMVYLDAAGEVVARSSGALPIDEFAALVDEIAV